MKKSLRISTTPEVLRSHSSRQWRSELIAISLGRSVSACQKAYDHLLSLAHPPTVYPVPYRPTNYIEPKPPMVKPKKRPYGSDGSMAVDRIIQPRTSEFSAVNETYHSPLHPAAPSPGGEPPKKKRGRPSKAEYEVRVAEYAARGESYPAPRKSKASRHSAETQALFTPTTKTETIDSRPASTLATMEASEAGSPPGKRRARPNKMSRNFTLDTSALTQLPGEESRGDSNTLAVEAAGERPGLETQPSDLMHRGDPTVQAQEHPARLASEPGRDVETIQEQHTPENRAWQAYQAPKTN